MHTMQKTNSSTRQPCPQALFIPNLGTRLTPYTYIFFIYTSSLYFINEKFMSEAVTVHACAVTSLEPGLLAGLCRI